MRLDDLPEAFVDLTYVSRRDSGMERVARRLFSPDHLRPFRLRPVLAGPSRLQMIAAQMIRLPALAWRNPDHLFLFTGYPPSFLFPIGKVPCALYVHDIFLLSRRADLNFAGRHYLAPQFRRAIRDMRIFFCNSEETAAELRTVCSPDAAVLLYRPKIENVFDLSAGDRANRQRSPDVLNIVSVGTVEPRKNFRAAAKICAALAGRYPGKVRYHIIGRKGWGSDWEAIAGTPDVVLHGYLDPLAARQVLDDADLVLCTSHAEGLGLPLIEVQYAGLPVVAPNAPVFHEVLGASGIFIDPEDADKAAEVIADRLNAEGWRERAIASAVQNVARWNALAQADRARVLSFLESTRKARQYSGADLSGGEAPC